MKYSRCWTVLVLVAAFTGLANVQSHAQQGDAVAVAAGSPQPQSTHTARTQEPGSPIIKTGTSARKIGVRLKDWTTVHASSDEDARVTISTLKKIGCEVESSNHGNHIDVRYRCPDWKSMKLGTDQLVNQWTTWCESKGMETVVINPVPGTKKPTVKFRLPAERTVHLHDESQAKQILNTLQLIGCEVVSNSHGDHLDATFNCPQWITLEVPSETKAHAWQKWLDESGFETQHTHQ